jgi:hypothetical protein
MGWERVGWVWVADLNLKILVRVQPGVRGVFATVSPETTACQAAQAGQSLPVEPEMPERAALESEALDTVRSHPRGLGTSFMHVRRSAASLVALLTALALLVGTARDDRLAAGEIKELGTDRDAFTPSTLTVPEGTRLTEGSYVYIDNLDSPPTNSYPELLLRVPVADWLEVRFGANYCDNGGGYIVTNAEGGEGRDDGTLFYESSVLYGFKAIATRQDGLLPQSCVIVEAFTPTYGDFSSTIPVATYALGWKTDADWRLDAAIRYVYAESRTGWFDKWAPSIVLRVPATERWEVHMEYFSSFTVGLPDEKTSPFVSPGTHYMLTDNLEVGIRIGWGLTRDAAAFFSDAGFGWRF